MWCALLSPEVERNGIEDVSRFAWPFQRGQHVYYRLTFYQIPLFLTQYQSRAEMRSGDSLLKKCFVAVASGDAMVAVGVVVLYCIRSDQGHHPCPRQNMNPPN